MRKFIEYRGACALTGRAQMRLKVAQAYDADRSYAVGKKLHGDMVRLLVCRCTQFSEQRAFRSGMSERNKRKPPGEIALNGGFIL